MNKKLFILPISTLGILLGITSFKHSSNFVKADDTIVFDVNSIEALSHAGGVTISFLSSDIAKYWDTSALDFDELKKHYEINREMEAFTNYLSSPDYLRDLYLKWDDFKPVNNTLIWRTSLRASSYDIVVSRNAELTDTIYEAKGLTEASYTLENPYSNTHYFWQVTVNTSGGSKVKSRIFDFYSADYKRTLYIPGVSNTRDIGGVTTSYGTLQEGYIYRGARLDDIQQEGIDVLNRLNVQTDLDIRYKGEGKENPSNRTNYYLRTMEPYFNTFSLEKRESTIEALRTFSVPENYPIFFHCSVGRDRTGTCAIILQALLGCSEEYILHDYYTSMWSVTGAFPKTSTNMYLENPQSVLDHIKAYGGSSLAESAELCLKKSDTEEFGLTDEEIKSIRDIWTGKVDAPNVVKGHKASENYEGKAYVTFKGLGHQDVCLMVAKGSNVSAPYQLENGYAWYVNGEGWDSSLPINDTVVIYSDYVVSYSVTIHFIGLNKQDDLLAVKIGDVITFEQYKIDGYEMTLISDQGKLISKLTVTRNSFINIIYNKIK